MSEKSQKSIDTKPILPENVKSFDAFWKTNDERAKADANSSSLMCRRYLKLLGIWPMGDDGKLSWKFGITIFLSIVCYFSLVIRTFPTILYVILDATNALEIWVIISRLLFCFMVWMKYGLLRFQRRNIQKCMKDIESDWLMVDTSASRDIMLKYSRYRFAATRFFALATYAGAAILAVLPYVSKKSANAVAENENVTQVVAPRVFTVPSHFGFAAATVTPIYQVLYTSQIAATFVMQTISIASYTLVVVTVMHACGQLKILMEKIRSLIDDDGQVMDNASVDNRLADIVRHHVRILRFISRAEKMLQGNGLTELSCSTVLMCLVGYFNIVAWKAERKNVVAIIVWAWLQVLLLFNMFSYCFIGEFLTQECARVGEITYTIHWYRLPGKQPLALSLIMTMAHRPVALTAGGAVPFSIQCFASVVKTAMGYLNMLRTVMD